MKKKFIILTLIFSIILTNIRLNDYKTYANEKSGIAISVPMLAVVSTVAVGTGYAIKNIDDVYDIGKKFMNYCGDTWSDVVETFNNNISIALNGSILVGATFLNLLKSFLQSEYNPNLIGYVDGIPVYENGTVNTSKPNLNSYLNVSLEYPGETSSANYSQDIGEKVYLQYKKDSSSPNALVYIWTKSAGSQQYPLIVKPSEHYLKLYAVKSSSSYGVYDYSSPNVLNVLNAVAHPLVDSPFNPGLLDDKVNDDGDLPVWVPGQLGSLPGTKGDDVFAGNNNPPYELPNDGVIELPSDSLPGINVDTGSNTLPGVSNPPSDVPGDVPSEGLFATIKDFIISLVVPSDTFWTDTFNGFKDNFSKNFPMLDMSKFDSLAVGGKPFPNLYAYGSKIVDGDVINSIVDWLRPIVAGFIMICLMFFNYRKIYKLIRNTEPFGGIAQGTSDFRTGLSAPPINNGLDPNPMGNLRDTLFDMRNEILRRENSK